MQKLAGFSYVVRPFARSRRSLRYPATSFPRILCCQPLSQRAIVCHCLKKRCKVVVARATYFISLKDVSFAPKNQRSKHCGHSRDRTCDPFLRREMLYSTELCVHVGTGNATYQSRFGRCRQQKILNLPSRATFKHQLSNTYKLIIICCFFHTF